jgi:hypothetical protein
LKSSSSEECGAIVSSSISLAAANPRG